MKLELAFIFFPAAPKHVLDPPADGLALVPTPGGERGNYLFLQIKFDKINKSYSELFFVFFAAAP